MQVCVSSANISTISSVLDPFFRLHTSFLIQQLINLVQKIMNAAKIPRVQRDAFTGEGLAEVFGQCVRGGNSVSCVMCV